MLVLAKTMKEKIVQKIEEKRHDKQKETFCSSVVLVCGCVCILTHARIEIREVDRGKKCV